MRKLLIGIGFFAILFVIFIWWRADQGDLPVFITSLYNFPFGDKVGHFLLMGLLTFFVCLPFCRGEWGRVKKRVLIIGIVIVAIVTAEEMSQQFFASRTLDVLDLLSSYAGIGCAVAFLLVSRFRRAKQESGVLPGSH